MNLSRAILLNLELSITPNGSGSNPNASVPSGYLKSLFYKQDGTAVVSSLQIKHLQSGSGNWQDLELTYTAPERGYVQVFVANESDQEVFFDQMEVEHIPQLIVQENHYYPFGLELAGLNKRGKPEHRWKFQGQEEQKEFGLNWSSFKWRNADVALGRFFSVDPLAEDYVYNSTYAFSENQVTAHVELEGLEKYYTADGKLIAGIGRSSQIRIMRKYDARLRASLRASGLERTRKVLDANSVATHNNLDLLAARFGAQYNAESIVLNQEYGARIGSVNIQNGGKSKTVYVLGTLTKGDSGSADLEESNIFGTKLAAGVHTHGEHPSVEKGYSPGDHFNNFSGGPQKDNFLGQFGDIDWVKKNNVPLYLANPAGQLKVYEPQVYKPGAEKGRLIRSDITYDPRSGSYMPNGKKKPLPAYDVNLLYDNKKWTPEAKHIKKYQPHLRYEGVLKHKK